MNTLQDIRLQFKQETSVEVKDANIQGEKLIKIIEKQLKELKHHSESLYKDTESQLAKGKEKLSKTRKGGDYFRTVKLANEVGQVSMDEAEALEIPDTISHESLRKFVNELGPALTKTIKLKKSYDPYITPYFIRARRSIEASLGKLQTLMKELSEFISTTYRRVHHIHKTLEAIDRLNGVLEDIPPLDTILEQEQGKSAELTNKIQQLEDKNIQLNNQSISVETSTIEQEIRNLELNAFQKLRIFRDPINKMLYRAKGGPGLSTELKEKAEGYMEHPLERFREEDIGHPQLIKLLNVLNESLAQDAVSLKKRKEVKTINTIEEILNKNILRNIQEKIRDLESKLQQLMDTNEFHILKRRKDELQGQIQELITARSEPEKIINQIEKEKQQKIQQIELLAQRITQNIKTFNGTSVQISIDSLI